MSGSRILIVMMGLAASSFARAQTVYNADGTPSMLGADAAAASTAPNIAASGPPGAPPPPGPTQQFDDNCDPSVENCVDPDADAYDDGYDPNAYQQFDAALQPYGTWTDDPSYGQVWEPSPEVVGTDFEPYESGGQWIASSDYGFNWVSDWDWGWAPFHYGRWIWRVPGGWAWIPGSIWGPAWVNWRYGGGYVGWAPMGPRGTVTVAPARGASSSGRHSSLRFAVASELFRRNPTLVPAQVIPSVWARTARANNPRPIVYNGPNGAVNARVNLGPSLATMSHDLGRSLPAMMLRNTAPSALPRASIVTRAGVPVAQRCYALAASNARRASLSVERPGVPMHSSSTGVQRQQGGPARTMSEPQPYRFGNTTSLPEVRSPNRFGPATSAPEVRSPTSAPASVYTPSGYYHPSAPAPTAAPVYERAPARTYEPPAERPATYAPAAPSYHPAPSAAPAPTPSPAPAPAPAAVSHPSYGGNSHRR